MGEKNVILETDRLILREYCQDDLLWLYEILTDTETMKYYAKPYDESGVQKWLDWSFGNYEKHGFGLWVIELKESGESIGDAGLTMQPINGQWLPEIGYHVNKKYWRRGIAKEAASAVRDWAFVNTDFTELYSYMTVENTPSQATARSIGMTKIEEYTDVYGEDLAVWKITREEWLAEKTRKEN